MAIATIQKKPCDLRIGIHGWNLCTSNLRYQRSPPRSHRRWNNIPSIDINEILGRPVGAELDWHQTSDINEILVFFNSFNHVLVRFVRSTCYGDMKNCIFKCHLSKFHNFGVINLLHCHTKIARDSPCWTPDTSLSTLCLLSKRKFQIGNLFAVLEGIMILCRCTRGHACCRRCCGKRSMLYLDDSTSWKIVEGWRNHSKDWKFWSVSRLLRCTFTPFAKLQKNEV